MDTKDAMLGGLRTFFGLLTSYGHTPTEAWCDCAGEVGTRFIECAQELGLKVCKNVSGDPQGQNERQYQSVKHDMASSLISQENLTVDFWGYCMMNCRERRNACINSSHPTMTPEEQITGKAPRFAQMSFHFGQLAASKRKEKKSGKNIFDTNYELVCVVGSPNSLEGIHLVLQQGQTIPVARNDLKFIKEYPTTRSEGDWNKIQPTFSPTCELLTFHAGTSKNFTLQNVLKRADERNFGRTPAGTSPAANWQGRITVDGEFAPFTPRRKSTRASNEPNAVQTEGILRSMMKTSEPAVLHLQQTSTDSMPSAINVTATPAPRRSFRLEAQTAVGESLEPPIVLNQMPEAQEILEMLEKESDDTKQHGDTEGHSSAVTEQEGDEVEALLSHITRPALHIPCFVTSALSNAATIEDIMKCGETLQASFESYSNVTTRPVFKTRAIRTNANPSLTQVLRSVQLQEAFGPAVRKFIDGGLEGPEPIHRFVSKEDVIRENIFVIPHVCVFDTKRLEPGQQQEDAKKKFRLTPDGSKEPAWTFAPGSTASSPIDSATLFQTIAIGASLGCQCLANVQQIHRPIV